MQFTVAQISDKDGFNMTEVIAEAAAYPWVRTMTVGQTTTSTFPLQQFAVPPIQLWASAADPKVIAAGAWSATSAACWFFGKGLTDELKIPIGLVSSNWGGTIIQSWSNNATNKACGISDANPPSVGSGAPAGDSALDYVTPGFEARVAAGPDPNHGFGVLYNAMIAPLALGPMSISSMIWFRACASART
jgi:sialate O-acetylesterase